MDKTQFMFEAFFMAMDNKSMNIDVIFISVD